MENYFEFEGFNDDLLIGNEEKSNFALDPFGNEEQSSVVGAIAGAVGAVATAAGSFATASATKATAEAEVAKIGGKRTAQNKDCATNPANNFSYLGIRDTKKSNNRIKDCQTEVKKRLDLEEEEQKQIIRRQTTVLERETEIAEKKALGDIETRKSTIQADALKSKTMLEEKKSGKKLYVYGGIASLFVILGVVVYLKSKK
jgi:hypothetical protein